MKYITPISLAVAAASLTLSLYVLFQERQIEVRVKEIAVKVTEEDPQYIYVDANSMTQNTLHQQIVKVTKAMGLYTEDVAYLLMFTAAVESDMGRYLKQIGGPAQGIFQMEPNTEASIFKHYLPKKPELLEFINKLKSGNPIISDLEGNIQYQIAMARIYYLSKGEALPKRHDKNAIYAYYKKYWNTEKGKATEEKAFEKINRYLIKK